MYAITLQDAPSELPERLRQDAEQRFRRTLERSLGNPDTVLAAYRAWQNAEDSASEEISADELSLAKRWMTAVVRARNEGLREAGETEAWFEIKLLR